MVSSLRQLTSLTFITSEERFSIRQYLVTCFITSVILNHPLQNGVRHGFYREFKHNNNFWSFGKFVNGKKSGIHWTKVEGNAFLVGEVDSENTPKGDSLYLYPDLCTAIQGQYHQGKLASGGEKKIWWIFLKCCFEWILIFFFSTGRLVRLRDCREEAGILIAETSETAEDDSVIEYDQSGRVCISRTPHHRSTSSTLSALAIIFFVLQGFLWSQAGFCEGIFHSIRRWRSLG